MTDPVTTQMSPVTFRLPPVVIRMVDEFAADVADWSDGTTVTLSDVYRWAFQRYLGARGYKMPTAPLFESIGFEGDGEIVDLDDSPTRTVCVHISSEMREHFGEVLTIQQQQLGPMVGTRLTTSSLLAVAVGELLFDAGYRMRGWNTA